MSADPKLLVSLSISALALAGSIYATLSNYRLARLNAELQNERDERTALRETRSLVSKFRDPLMQAAYDLQSRIFNILRGDFLLRHYANGSPREQEYAVENTVFLLAQFLGWTEAIRQEIRFLELDIDAQTRQLRELQDGIYTLLQTDGLGKGFVLFAGEQRAVGELMLDRATGVCRCLGFAAFVISRPPAIDHWLDYIRDDIKQMAIQLHTFEPRLVEIQHALITLLDFLDPEFVRFPQSRRRKV